MGRLASFRKISSSVLSLMIVVAGLVVLWAVKSNHVEKKNLVDEVLREAATFDPEQIREDQDEKYAIISGTLDSPDILVDEYLNALKFLTLERRVEMFQWHEDVKNGDDSKPMYRLGWYPNQVDFFSFKEPKGHENPLLSIEAKKLIVANCKIAKLDCNEVLKLFHPSAIQQISSENLTNKNTRTDGKYIFLSGLATSSKVPVGFEYAANLGDVRISYSGLVRGPVTIVGAIRPGRKLTTGASPSGTPFLFMLPGEISSAELRSQLKGTVASEGSGALYLISFALLTLGIFTMILPFAGTIDLRPRLPLFGPIAVFAISVGLGGALVMVGAILSFLM